MMDALVKYLNAREALKSAIELQKPSTKEEYDARNKAEDELRTKLNHLSSLVSLTIVKPTGLQEVYHGPFPPQEG